MKQKAVIKVSMKDQKCRKKALKTVVGCEGVESAAIQGKDKDQIAVIGDGIDAVKITTSLRKNLGNSEIISVSAVGEKEGAKQEGDGKKNDPNPKDPNPPVFWTSYPYTYNGMPYQHVYEVRDSSSDPCTIM